MTEEAEKIVLLQTIRFPEYLQTRNIATRISDNELQLSEMNNWAEPFDLQFTEYLSEIIRSSAKNINLITSTRYASPVNKLRVHVTAFEKSEEKEAVELTARWWVLDGKTNLPLKYGVFSESMKIKDSSYTASAAAHSVLIKILAATLVKQL